ncbi:STAS domain-containing protein [Niallia sp. NCCP-28]|uniref:STAS domain-containing protein n=1 Tax=Niallia sp. NCCP-28 TaxID=2934712 RepID=UPI00208A03F7|nr:STAS domain-containing protein [Niallia sp. NCCP-28]GKU84641.1 modulator protein RsbR [Niallia sp. NCCP-28]
MRKEFSTYIQNHREDIAASWIKRINENTEGMAKKLEEDHLLFSTSQEYIDLLIKDLLGLIDDSDNKIIVFIEKAVSINWHLNILIAGLQIFEEIIFEGMENEGILDKDKQLKYVRDFHSWLHPLCNKMIQTYSNVWERTVSMQKVALQELSAPLIPVFEGITIMPLVGTIDTQRAKQIMENLLNGVVEHRSEVVLIDITGVPVVDTMVAHHIIQATNAVRLVGTKSMIVGIRPEIAQTIVNLGINLDQFETKNTLKKGMESALEYTNRKLVGLG